MSESTTSKGVEGSAQVTSDVPFADKPSPWLGMKSQFFCSVGRAKGIPDASYADLEAQSPFADPAASGQFKGGACTVMIVRYLESPVGPYDEILWIPGWFEVPGKKTSNPRVTRIYVSRKESIYNGRKNWNIPKHLASFKFVPSDTPSSTMPYSRVEISLPSTPDQPFVVLQFSPLTLLSRLSMPINTSYVPINPLLGMPPVPESKSWKEDALMGTKEWRHARVDVSGWARMVRVEGKLGDGHSFPELTASGYWVYINDAKLSCVTVGV
ncbi:uncharacterized protein BDCG_02637 [Blastomyces dermatitidis ER-3]|uniref:Acetoacetate decarboxylase n=2 Tax=Ajellomyces dermatitidis TaxID=5039 RepID=F2T395_AJEDA|nr:uncharacterized protein BDCG_02637 [Blastomyces dermatitidis ER-3]EEQ87517.1 hypothetical protein BDCG_02637 [Blastomyces dermatitidis ER-3]EGE77897.2 hypothetical protein BDDG_00834 [Blastomyces dermatitidis ATCC 18188]